MITGLSHVSIVVPDLAAALEKLRAMYGLVAGEIKVNAEQGVRIPDELLYRLVWAPILPVSPPQNA
mgnify:CR=1 FL=1